MAGQAEYAEVADAEEDRVEYLEPVWNKEVPPRHAAPRIVASSPCRAVCLLQITDRVNPHHCNAV